MIWGSVDRTDYPILFDVLKTYEYYKSILGICLGFQVIGIYYGGDLYNLSNRFFLICPNYWINSDQNSFYRMG